MHDDPLERAKPYPELDPALDRVLRIVWARQGDITFEELHFESGWDTEAIARANRLRFVESTAEGRLRPSALALLYLRDEEGVDAILEALGCLVGLAAERYFPGAPKLSGKDITAATGIPTELLARVAPHAVDLGLRLRTDGSGEIVLEPTADAARRRTLAEWIAFRYDGAGAGGGAPLLSEGPGPLGLRLRGLRAERFRTLRRFDLALPSELTVLVGPNGAGKSTVLDLVAFVARATNEGLAMALHQESGLERLRTRGTTGPVVIEVEFDIDPGFGRETGRYGSEIDSPFGEPIVEREWLVVDGPDAPRMLVDGRRAAVRLGLAGGDAVSEYRGPGTLSLPALRDPDRFPVAVNVRRDLASVVLIDRDPILHDEPVPSGRRRQAARISDVLRAVAGDEARTHELGRALRELVPTVDGVDRIALTGEAPRLEVRERGLPGTSRLDELSAGTRQMLLLAALYVLPRPPRTILLEEPDAGLHVGALPALRDLLRSLAARSVVIATTHSPAFVGLLDGEREVVALDRHEDRVRARPLTAALGDRKWLEAFGSTAEAFLRAGMERAP